MTPFKKGDPMFRVYEVFKSDGKGFLAYEHRDKFDCEVWIRNHECDTKSVVNGLAEFVIIDGNGNRVERSL